MNAARISHTSTRLPNGKVLITDRNASAELYDPDARTFTPTGAMSEARLNATATLLKDGKVLIAGGGAHFTGTPLATAEIFDPDTGSFSPIAGTLQSARSLHTATLLPDGKVLIAGGFGTGGAIGAAELFDPNTRTFSAIPDMLYARYGHSATLLKDGKVLIAGGINNNNILGVMEIFDPSSSSQPFRLPLGGGVMANDRAEHTATLLPNGKVLITGGSNETSLLNTAEIYNPVGESSGLLVSRLGNSKANHTATLLPDGKVLLTGGQTDSAFNNTAELFDFTTNTFTTTGSMIDGRAWHTATLLVNGKVLVAGGLGVDSNNSSIYLSSAELFCPDSGVVSPAIVPAGTLFLPRTGHTATPLLDGMVLIAGGKNSFGQFIEQAELFNPATGDYIPISSLLPRTRANHTATRLPDGRVLFIGGMNDQFPAGLSAADVFDPQTNTFSTVGLTAFPRLGHTATLRDDGTVLIIGGDGRNEASVELFENGQFFWSANLQTKRKNHTATLLGGSVLIAGGSDSTKQAEVFDLITWQSNFTNTMDSKRSFHTATLLPNGNVLIAGGWNQDESFLGTAEIYHPAAQIFTRTDDMNEARSSHVATPLPNGKVLMVGGCGNCDAPDEDEQDRRSSIEIYDPATDLFSYAGFMEVPRTEGLTATLLSNCKVLIAGGGVFLRSELFSPTICGPGICGPNIQEFLYTFRPSGILMTIRGRNFGASQENSLVTLNDNPVQTVDYWSDAEISFMLPSGVTSGSVSVTVNGSASNVMTFSGICAANISGDVSVVRGGFRYNRTTRRYLQQITLANATNATIAGPVSLALDNLTSSVTLVNKSGNTACANPISPFINVNVDSDNQLNSGEKYNVILEFSGSTNVPINYTARVISGSPN